MRCGKKDGKKEKKKKGMERVCAEGREEEEGDVEKKMKKKEKEKRKRKRKKRIENGENGARGAPSSPNAFPSAKLGNNMTPIKGRLGKNTTPTSKSPTKLNQNLQADPRRRRSSFDASSPTGLLHAPKSRNIRSISSLAVKPPFIRRSRPSEIRVNTSNSP